MGIFFKSIKAELIWRVIWATFGDTEGLDGAAEVAGAIITPHTLTQAQAKGINARDGLARNDAHSFFAKIGGQVVTGPTLTNVNDFRAILIQPR